MFTNDQELIAHDQHINTLIAALLKTKTPRVKEFVIKQNKISLLLLGSMSIGAFLRLPKEDKNYETISQQIAESEAQLANEIKEEDLVGYEEDELEEEEENKNQQPTYRRLFL